jgi:ribose transport system substrate-binding protein
MSKALVRRRTAILAVVAASAVAAAAVATGASGSAQRPKVAFMSFAVANSYDAPMLKAAKDVARKSRATVTVFDAANDPKKQFSQLQTVISSKQYDAILVQPIFGPQLIPLVKQAIKAGIKVVNVDQILGTNPGTARPPVAGMSGNVVFIQTQIGRKQGALVLAACKANKLNPCNVGYLYSVKVSSLDTAIRNGFNSVIKANPNIKVVAEGETFYQHAVALKAAQTMLQARSDINLIVGADQGATGAELAAGNNKLVLVGYGGGQVGLNAVKAGRWYGTVMQRPATEGRLGMQCAVAAVKTKRRCGGIDVLKSLPQGGVVTKANVSKFKAEWPG